MEVVTIYVNEKTKKDKYIYNFLKKRKEKTQISLINYNENFFL